MRLEGRSVDHINWPLEETGDILLEAGVIVDGPFGIGLKLHQYVEITVCLVVATRNRAEHGGVRHATRAQRALVAAESGRRPERSSLKYSTKDLSMGDLAECGFSANIRVRFRS